MAWWQWLLLGAIALLASLLWSLLLAAIIKRGTRSPPPPGQD